MVADGELDETLVLPVSPLRHLLALRIDTPPIGDLIFGIGLFAFAATPTPSRILVFVVSSLAGAAVFTSFMVLCGSLTFFLGGRGEHGDMGFSAISMLAMYPVEIFGGPVRLVLFSVLPAALVSSVPADLLRHFNLAEEMALLGAAALISGLAAAVFRLGLRRYCSGSLWRT
jgi:ABC-2 type transport system permease protein